MRERRGCGLLPRATDSVIASKQASPRRKAESTSSWSAAASSLFASARSSVRGRKRRASAPVFVPVAQGVAAATEQPLVEAAQAEAPAAGQPTARHRLRNSSSYEFIRAASSSRRDYKKRSLELISAVKGTALHVRDAADDSEEAAPASGVAAVPDRTEAASPAPPPRANEVDAQRGRHAAVSCARVLAAARPS